MRFTGTIFVALECACGAFTPAGSVVCSTALIVAELPLVTGGTVNCSVYPPPSKNTTCGVALGFTGIFVGPEFGVDDAEGPGFGGATLPPPHPATTIAAKNKHGKR